MLIFFVFSDILCHSVVNGNEARFILVGFALRYWRILCFRLKRLKNILLWAANIKQKNIALDGDFMKVESKKETEGVKPRPAINREFCKGCGICMAFCPGKVFEQGDDQKVIVKRPEKCKVCYMCELRCPDFAIDIDWLPCGLKIDYQNG